MRVLFVACVSVLFELCIVLGVVALVRDMIWGEHLVIIGFPGMYNHGGVQVVSQSAPLADLE